MLYCILLNIIVKQYVFQYLYYLRTETRFGWFLDVTFVITF